MALTIEFSTLVGRIDVVDPIVEGGLDLWAAQQPNYAEDAHLFRSAAMATYESEGEAQKLVAAGVPPDAFAIVQLQADLPDWLERGVVDGRTAVWLAGTPPGALVEPIAGALLRLAASIDHVLDTLHAAGVKAYPAPPPIRRNENLYFLERGDASVEGLLFGPSGDRVGVQLRLRRDRLRGHTLGSDAALLRDLEILLKPLSPDF